MRDYQPKKNNPFYLPETLYRFALCSIRDIVERERQNEAITKAGSFFSEEQTKQIIDNIVFNKPFPKRNKRNTLSKARFIFEFSKANHWI